jgi:hypothetical protein
VKEEITDKYHKLNPPPIIKTFTPTPGKTESFDMPVKLEAWRNGDDLNGRVYTIHLTITDDAGNTVAPERYVIVPYDKTK